MKTRYRVLLALVLLALPALVRVLYFYQAPYKNSNIPQPDYTSYTIPQPPTPSSKVQTIAKIPNGKVVLLDNLHGNKFDPSEIEPLLSAISASGATVEIDTGTRPLELELKYASAYLVFTPSITFSGDELRVVQQFVESGGRLLVFGDPTRIITIFDEFGNGITVPDVNFINPLIAPYGLSLVNDYLYNLESNEGNFRNVMFTDFKDNALTKDLKMVVFYGAHSIQAEMGAALTAGDQKTFSSITDRAGGLTPIALSANGQVLAAGDFSFITNPFNQVADNARLLANIAQFANGAERNPTLVNFPFVFQRAVSVIPTGDIQIDSSFLQPIASLQQTLKHVNISVNLRALPAKEGDTIVLGTLAPSPDLNTYLKPFNIDLQNAGETLIVPGLGEINTSSVGILLLNHGPKSNTLVLLTPTVSDLPGLISLLASADLSACVLQENAAVCKLENLADGGDFNYYFPDAPVLPTEPALVPPSIEATPTASG